MTMSGANLEPELTALQAQALELRNGEKKLSWNQIAERMGVRRSSASEAYNGALRKIKKYGNNLGTRTPLSEVALPDESSDKMDRQFAKFVKKLRGGVTNELFLGLLEKGLLRACWILANDTTAFERLNAKELSLLIGHLTETRQLLRGEPTKIISIEDRRNLDELTEAWIKEATRRRQFVDLEPGDYSADPEGELRDVTKVRVVELPVK